MVSVRWVLRESSFAAIPPGRVLFEEEEKHGSEDPPLPGENDHLVSFVGARLIRTIYRRFSSIGKMV
jgi:hypothetical protein